jgi:hypothetical protein
VKFLPQRGLYQLVALKVPLHAIPAWSIEDRFEVLVGPFLADLNTGRLAQFGQAAIECAVFEEPEFVDVRIREDRPLHHDCAFGTLVETPGVYFEREGYTWSSTNDEGTTYVYHSDGNVVRSRRPDGTMSTGRLRYYYGSDAILAEDGTRAFVVGDLNFSYTQSLGTEDVSTVMSRLDVSANRLLWLFDLSSESEGTWTQEGWEFSFDDLTITGDEPVLVNVTRTVDVDGRLEGSVVPRPFEVVALSPTIDRSIASGGIIDTWLASVKSAIMTDLNTLASIMPPTAESDGCQKAVEAMRLGNVNGIAYVKDVLALKDALVPVIAVIKKPFSVKAWASLLLSVKYGARLTFQDTRALAKMFDKVKKCQKSWRDYAEMRNCEQTRYQTDVYLPLSDYDFSGPPKSDDLYATFGMSPMCKTYTRVVMRWNLPIEDSPWEEVNALINDMGGRITFADLWDLIPYSFVVDWFVDIGKVISRLDFEGEINKLTLRDRIFTSNCTAMTQCNAYEEFNLAGSLSMETYNRTLSPYFPPFPWKIGSPTFTRHWYEGALLVLQRIAK